jgi:anti-sigma factor RsiW
VTGCDHVRTELGGYVLGALEPAEAESVREHLARCSECAREHASIAQLPDLLSLAEAIETAPPLPAAIEERVLDAVARERTRPASRRARRLLLRPRVLLPIAAVAAALAIALVIAGGSGDEGPPYQVALRPVAGSAAGGRAQLESTAGGTTLHMWVKGLPADPSVVYEVRCKAPDWDASAGTFRVDTHGRAVVVLTTAARRGEYDSISVVRRSRTSSTDVLTASLN